MTATIDDNLHKSYSEVTLEAQHNRELFLREVTLHNATIMQKHNKIVYLEGQIKELEQKLIDAEKGRRDLVVHYEQQIRNLDGCEELVKTMNRKLTLNEPVDKT